MLNNFGRICLFALTFALSFVFGGCDLFSNTSIFGGGGGNSSSNTTDSRINPNGQNFVPQSWNPGEDDKRFTDENFYDDMIEQIQGVRTTYLPTSNSATLDTELQADRDKFLSNAKEQYQLLSIYILRCLVGEYGVAVPEDSRVYDFYANTTGLPEGTTTSLTVVFPAVSPATPVTIPVTRLETHAEAIEHSIRGLGCDEDNNIYHIYENVKWNCSLGTTEFNEQYLTDYLNRFTSFLQIRLMETKLGIAIATTLNQVISNSAEEITELLNSYAYQIERLGVLWTREDNLTDELVVTQNATLMQDYIDVVLNEVIGANPMARENAEVEYTEPNYTIMEEIEGVMSPVTVPWDMDGTLLTTFTKNDFYKYDYENIVSQIVNNALNIAVDFPTYCRLEKSEISANKFYSPGSQDEETKIVSLTNMEEEQYESAVIFAKEKWNYYLISMQFDTNQDITLDVYLRLHIAGVDHIVHISRLATDSTLDYGDPGQTEVDNNNAQGETSSGPNLEDYFDTSYKRNSIVVELSTFLPELIMKYLSNLESVPVALNVEDKSYKNSLNDKTTTRGYFAKGYGKSCTNFDNVTFLFDDKYLYQSDENFIEFIFDVKEDENITNKAFRFSVSSLSYDELYVEE